MAEYSPISRAEQLASPDQVEPKSTVEMTGNEVIKQAIEVGLGLSVLSAHTVELELSAGRLVRLDVVGMPIIRRWYVAHRSGKRLTPNSAVLQAICAG